MPVKAIITTLAAIAVWIAAGMVIELTGAETRAAARIAEIPPDGTRRIGRFVDGEFVANVELTGAEGVRVE